MSEIENLKEVNLVIARQLSNTKARKRIVRQIHHAANAQLKLLEAIQENINQDIKKINELHVNFKGCYSEISTQKSIDTYYKLLDTSFPSHETLSMISQFYLLSQE